jgi:hypothetical protein
MQVVIGNAKKKPFKEDERTHTRSVVPIVPHSHITGLGIRFDMEHNEEARVPIPMLQSSLTQNIRTCSWNFETQSLHNVSAVLIAFEKVVHFWEYEEESHERSTRGL